MEHVTAHPRMFEHVLSVYRKMYSESVDQGDVRVWHGSAVDILKQLSIPGSYYGPIFKFGRDANIMALVRRGGNGSDSLWGISDTPPTFAIWSDWNSKDNKKQNNIKDAQEHVMVALADMQNQLTKLESDMDLLKKVYGLLARQAGLVTE